MSTTTLLKIDVWRFPQDIEGFFLTLLEQHDVQVSLSVGHLTLLFPAGTMRTRRRVYVVHTAEYIIHLPDGLRLYQSEPRNAKYKSHLGFDLQDVPLEIQQAHPRGVSHREEEA